MLDGKVVIVTGATRGIGRVVALAAAREGAKVVVTGKSLESSDKLPGSIFTVADEVRALGKDALPLQLDVRDDASISHMVEETVSAFGRIDVLINNAGALWWQPVMDTPMKRFDLMMGVNVRAAFACSRAVIPHMQKAGGGHIVNYSPPIELDILSIKATSKTNNTPVNRNVGYLISKFGMTMLAQGLAEEMRSQNIAVNALWPATAIESQATINWELMTQRDWRKPDIIADATVTLIRLPASAAIADGLTGQSLIDEDFLRVQGISDFTKYRCDPDHEPPRLSLEHLATA